MLNKKIEENLDGNPSKCTVNYDVLDEMLPRYLRQVWKDDTSTTIDDAGNILCTSTSGNVITLYKVHWNPLFFAVPGNCPLSQYLRNYKELGFFPMDIASSLAVFALDLPSEYPCSVLDLCCCPGAKLRMIADRIHHQSTLVGVDISAARLSVCKSLMESWEELLFSKQILTPRQFLFLCDGAHFGGSSLGALTFDSSVLMNNLRHSGNHRKRKNKSSKLRDDKRLKIIHRTMNQLGGFVTNNITDAKADMEENCDELRRFSQLKQFDYVLVDAECTHDASYRHMKYVAKSHKWNQDVSLTEDEDVSGVENGQKLALSHNIRDLKTSHEGRLSLQSTQRSLIENGFNRVVPGGVLVYSTCSLEVEQNEDIVRWLLDNFPNAQLEDVGMVLNKYFPIVYNQDVDEIGINLFYPNKIGAQHPTAYCSAVCSNSALPLQEGLLKGTVKVDASAGMSGHFIARISKQNSTH